MTEKDFHVYSDLLTIELEKKLYKETDLNEYTIKDILRWKETIYFEIKKYHISMDRLHEEYNGTL